MVLRPLRALPIPLLVVWVSVWGCAQRDVRLGDSGPDAGLGERFTPLPNDDASADGGDADTPADVLMCVATECPDPFATCPASGLGYKCGVDLSRDPDNCGTCGNKCLNYPSIHMTSRCVDRKCELECFNDVSSDKLDMRNCNGAVDDGCEADVMSDTQNCGSCGKVCAAGQPCIRGKCGCAPGYIACPGIGGVLRCTNPLADDFNCNGCGNVCPNTPPPGGCTPLPKNTYYGCGGGTCGQIKCGGSSADCNKDLPTLACASDGCEVDDLEKDRNNCGGCGIKCAANEQCIDEGNGYECAVPCTRFGKSKCPRGCFDLLNDPNNCGGCDDRCRNAGPNEVRTCKKGVCAFECVVGFADCNGDVSDGCEVNLRNNPGNCGACGVGCNIAAGQPCIDGKCLLTECDAGGPVQ